MTKPKIFDFSNQDDLVDGNFYLLIHKTRKVLVKWEANLRKFIDSEGKEMSFEFAQEMFTTN